MFKSKSVQNVSDQQYTVTGDLTFHGVTKPLIVQANITGQGKDRKVKCAPVRKFIAQSRGASTMRSTVCRRWETMWS
jgi:polyisoprenoid-binding protein YceI